MPTVKSISIDPAFTITILGDGGSPWDIIVPSGTVSAKKTILINSQASGGAAFNSYVEDGCVDGGGNTGWEFVAAITATVVTNASTLVTTVSCTANGEITLIKDVSVTRRGFCFKVGTSGGPTVSDNVVYEDGSFSVGAYSLSITGLAKNTHYRIRAYVTDGVSVYYGDSINLVSYPAAPANVSINVASEGDGLVISWDAVSGVDTYTLYYGTEPGVTKSSVKFSGITGLEYTHVSLTAGVWYYYAVSSVAGSLESDLSAEVSLTPTGNINLPAFRPQNWLDTEDYVLILTSQYQLAENFKDWLRHNVDICKDGMLAANQMNNDFDIDFASGIQLDMIGEIVGQSRTLPFQPTDGSDPELDDATYRMLLKAKVALNHWDGQLLSIEQKWVSIFPNTSIYITDNQDMSLTISVLGEISYLIQDLIEHDMIVPRPQGVRFNYTWSPRVIYKFSYDSDIDEFRGYDLGHWTNEGLA